MPWQPSRVGITVIVPEIGAPVVLVEVNDGTLPVPPAPSPIAVLLFVHVNVAPVGELEKVVPVTPAPRHTPKLAGTIAVGVGLTVIV